MKTKYITVAIATALLLGACTRVPAGTEGVMVKNFGQGDGVQEQELGVGWHATPPGTEIRVFELFEQTYVWDVSGREDQRFFVQDKDGMRIGMGLGIRFKVIPGRSSDLVSQFRTGLDDIVNGRIRNMIRTALNNEASTRSAEEIYGGGREEFLMEVQDRIIVQLTELGLTDIELYWVSELDLPVSVRNAIEAKIEAEQEAMRRERQIEITRAEAEQAIQRARGESEARLLAANAEAEALRIQGEALRQNPQVLALNAIEAWASGGAQMPQTLVIGSESGTVVPFLDVQAQNNN